MRSALPGLWAALVLAAVPATTDAGPNDETVALENASCRVEVSRAHGTIVRIHDRRGGLELIQEPRLADNFRFTLPLRGPTAWQSTEANFILGKDQSLSSQREVPGGLILRWNGPLRSVFGTPYDVSAEMAIRLAGEEVRFEFKIENRTGHEIGEVFAPIVGGTLGLGDRPEDRKQTLLVLPSGTGVQSSAIFQTFVNHSWLGVIGPEQFYAYPDTLVMPWMELTQPRLKRGVYFGAHDSVARYKVLHLEMLPGTAGNRAGGNWPRKDEVGNLPAGVKLALVHMPYQPAGATFEASPVVLRFHDGDWSTAARIHGDWLASQFDLTASRRNADPAAAFHECRAVPFRDLPRWAEEGARRGVNELLVAGWAVADAAGEPRFEPDPNLGTRDDLARTVVRCHELGVRVVLDVRLQPVAMDHPWYMSELQRYACRDRWGIVWTRQGWGDGSTLTRQFGTTEHRALLNPGAPGFRQILVRQFRALAELGIDGLHLHEFVAKPMDFNPATGKTPDRASWEGEMECLAAIQQACRSTGRAFSLCTDPAWDRVLSVSLTTSAELGEPSPLRAAFPALRSTFSVTEPDDFAVVNEAVRLGGLLRIAPANLRPMGGSEMAGLAGYIQAVLAARDALRDTLVEGEPRRTEGLTVAGGARLGLFRSARTGLRTAVLVNPGGRAIDVTLSGFPSPAGRPAVLWRPSDGARAVTSTATLTLDPDGLAFVTEEPAQDRLAAIARWTPAGGDRGRQVVFDLRSVADLEGWTYDGTFQFGAMSPLFRTPTLNSLASGEGGVGTATSPPFTIGPEYAEVEILMQGGTSSRESGQENLALRFVDVRTGALLAQALPPSTHVLVVQRLATLGLTGKPLRIELVDRNRASSFAWIGLRRVTLLGKTR